MEATVQTLLETNAILNGVLTQLGRIEQRLMEIQSQLANMQFQMPPKS